MGNIFKKGEMYHEGDITSRGGMLYISYLVCH